MEKKECLKRSQNKIVGTPKIVYILTLHPVGLVYGSGWALVGNETL